MTRPNGHDWVEHWATASVTVAVPTITLNQVLRALGYSTAPVILRNGDHQSGRKHVIRRGTLVLENVCAADVWHWLATGEVAS